GGDFEVPGKLYLEVHLGSVPAIAVVVAAAVKAVRVALVVTVAPHDAHDDAVGCLLHGGREVLEVAAVAALDADDLHASGVGRRHGDVPVHVVEAHCLSGGERPLPAEVLAVTVLTVTVLRGGGRGQRDDGESQREK